MDYKAFAIVEGFIRKESSISPVGKEWVVNTTKI